MGQRHKHHDVIVAWAAGQTVQYREVGFGAKWEDAPSPLFSEKTEYRIKPEPPAKVYPGTRMNDFELCVAFEPRIDGIWNSLTAKNIANAALRHAIDSGQLVEPNPARDMAIAKAVRDRALSDDPEKVLAAIIATVKD